MAMDMNSPAVTGYLVTPSGLKVPVNRVHNIKEALHSIIEHTFLEPYDGKNTKLIGKTKIEAAILCSVDQAAEGNTSELHELLNRVMGMPKQSSENINVTANLADFLSDLEQNNPPTAEERQAAGVVDAEFSIDEEV